MSCKSPTGDCLDFRNDPHLNMEIMALKVISGFKVSFTLEPAGVLLPSINTHLSLHINSSGQ